MKPRKFSAGVVVVSGGPPDVRYLLLRAYNYWDFPKGVVDPEEVPLAAARREVEEETGITALEFRWGEDYCETEPYAGGKVARYYLASTSEPEQAHLPVSPELGRPEHHEFRWVDYAEGKKLLNARVGAVLAWAHDRINSHADIPITDRFPRRRVR